MATSQNKTPRVIKFLRKHVADSSSSVRAVNQIHFDFSGVHITKTIVAPENTSNVEDVETEENDHTQQQTVSPKITTVQRLKNELSQDDFDLSNVQITKVNQSSRDEMERQNFRLLTSQQIDPEYHDLSPTSPSIESINSEPSTSVPRRRRTYSSIDYEPLAISNIALKKKLETKSWWKNRCACWYCSPFCFGLLSILLLLFIAVATTAVIFISKSDNGRILTTTNSAYINTTTISSAYINITTTGSTSINTTTTSSAYINTTISSASINTTTATSSAYINITTTTSNNSTTISCSSGYIPAPSGICVNIQIDFNNCGSIGYVCSSNYTSCSAGVCSTVPAVQLVGGIGVFSSLPIDDDVAHVHLPLSITMYNYSTSNVTISSNGIVCLGGCSDTYSNGNLPESSISPPTAFGYWSDLYIQSHTSQNIYYGVDGIAPNRTTTFEFYTTHFGNNNQYYHFQIVFYENMPNIVKYIYFQASDGGVSATIGVQKSSNGPSITYSVDRANSVTSNMTLIFDTSAGTVVG
ncbi:unnamed protein product [Adineta steineri]|uniref:Uncharacterized protein n=1 Tax=Adineta steineri TaxID=433720 RepID=A0A813VQN2_9BILA|nr:unnamed protein product [Adineta steineri]CAF1188608.1 unnamed protein product [Adineta steineri]CAF1194123.1 unnamed protein product [Adineta steineri]